MISLVSSHLTKVTEALGTPQLLGSVLPASERKPGRETTDLFSAHDFDIQIELPSSATSKCIVVFYMYICTYICIC